jgi:pyruvate-ferredoxin/flavodoxin oxidoreductase
VLASGRNVNVLVLDTEVYSNTGGQMSKSTPRGAVAKFAAGGKGQAKKDLGLLAMSYGSVYVAHVAFGAADQQTLRAFREAEAYDGPSLIIAYSPCIAHGFDIGAALQHQKSIVGSGQWLLYRHDPARADRGENPMQLDSRAANVPLADFFRSETRFGTMSDTVVAAAQKDVDTRRKMYEYLVAMKQ